MAERRATIIHTYEDGQVRDSMPVEPIEGPPGRLRFICESALAEGAGFVAWCWDARGEMRGTRYVVMACAAGAGCFVVTARPDGVFVPGARTTGAAA